MPAGPKPDLPETTPHPRGQRVRERGPLLYGLEWFGASRGRALRGGGKEDPGPPVGLRMWEWQGESRSRAASDPKDTGTGGPWPDLQGLGRSLAGRGRSSPALVWMWVGAARPPPTKLRKLHAGGLQPLQPSTSRALEDLARAHRYQYLFAYTSSHQKTLDVPSSACKARSYKSRGERPWPAFASVLAPPAPRIVTASPGY